MLQKLFAMILALLMIASCFAGCGSDSDLADGVIEEMGTPEQVFDKP